MNAKISAFDWMLAGSVTVVLFLAAWQLLLLRMGRHLRTLREREERENRRQRMGLR